MGASSRLECCYLVMQNVEVVACLKDFSSKCFESQCLICSQASWNEMQLEDDNMIRIGAWLWVTRQPAYTSAVMFAWSLVVMSLA